MIQEKTNRADAYMFKQILDELLKDNMDIFSFLNKPSLTPPEFVFPIVWTILYILMGIASYLVLTTDKTDDFSLFFYGLQLFFNFFWSILYLK